MRAVYESLCDALIRFFDSLFTKSYRNSEEVNYLRMEISKLQEENRKFVEALIDKGKPVEQSDIPENYEPVRRVVPWAVKRYQLEKASRERAIAMAKEATEKKESNGNLTADIDKLEKELNINDAVS